MAHDPTERRPDIQGLRALAVLLVAGNHAKVPGLGGGYVGVDVFFVVSGFLITGLLARDATRSDGGRVHFVEFYARRARRILPAATVVIVATCVAATLVLDRITARGVLTDAGWAAVFLANVRFSTQGTDYFHQHAPSPLQHYWSLAVEEQFYLVWPVLIALTLVAVGRRRPAGPRVPLTLVLLALVIGSFTLSAVQTGTGAYFSSLGRAWELGLGGLLALTLPSVVTLLGRWAAAVSWVGLGLVGLAAVQFDSATRFPGTAALVPVLGTVLLIAGGASSRAGTGSLLTLRPLRYIGDVSYSFYLWHWPLLVLGAAWAGHALRIRQSLGLVAVAFVLAVLTYHLVENPLRRARWLTARRSLRSLALWPTALAVVAVSIVVLRPADPALAGPDPHAIRSAAGPFDSLPLTTQVQVSAEAAQARGPVPDRLSPQPEGIAGDFHEIGHCSGYKKVSNDVCQFGDPQGAHTLVLWGNSHATMWIPALAEIAHAHHWQFFPLVKEACAYGGFAGTNNPRCRVWAAWSRQQLARLHPDLLVMGGDYGETGWQAGFTQTLALLEPLAARVAVLQLAPGLDQAPTECLFTRGANLGTCAKTEGAAQLGSDEQLRGLAEQGGATWIPTRQWFCWQDLCPAVIGPRVPYADVGHVTATYARHVAPALDAELAPLLGG